MKWEKYQNDFTVNARHNGFSDVQIKKCLDYALKLFNKNLPIIYNQTHLSLLVGYELEYLIKASNSSYCFYREFKIPKKSGGTREIAEPLPSLKEIQKWVLQEILNKCAYSSYAKAYIPKTSIKDNARFHRGQEKVLAIDVNDFFGSIKYYKIYDVFHGLGYSKSVSAMLANLCCRNGCLPQGAPTSPALSNLVAASIDKRIAGLSKKQGFRYTRYSDDLAFSGKFKAGLIINFVRNVLSAEGFSINESKIRLMQPHQRQEVTGIITNEKLQAPRELRKKIRQEIYYIQKYGVDSHLEKSKNTRSHYMSHLLGTANFIHFVNPNDKFISKHIVMLKKLLHDSA